MRVHLSKGRNHARLLLAGYVHIISGTEAHHYATWQKHDHSVAVACHACKKPASSNKAMAAVSAEKARGMQGVLREQTKTFITAMREQLQGTDWVPVREAAFVGMRQTEGNGFERAWKW